MDKNKVVDTSKVEIQTDEWNSKEKSKQFIYIIQASSESTKCKIGKTNDVNYPCLKAGASWVKRTALLHLFSPSVDSLRSIGILFLLHYLLGYRRQFILSQLKYFVKNYLRSVSPT